MIKDITVRKCRSNECSVVLGIWKEAGSMTSVTDNVEVLRRLLKLDSTTLLVAEHQGKLVGTIIAAWDGWRGNIYRLAVLPGFRRQGIARLLVRAAEDFLVPKGAQRIHGLVDKEGLLAVPFWNSLADAGFERDETFIRYIRSITNIK